MPTPRYQETRVLSRPRAWDLLSAEPSWEIDALYGDRVRVGTPPVRPKSQVGTPGLAQTQPDATADQNGVVIEALVGAAGARWVLTPDEARGAFDEVLSRYAEDGAGDERLFRVKLLISGSVVDERVVAAGQRSPERAVLDGLSLTYIGVVASIALAFAFGIQNLATLPRIGVGIGMFVGLVLLLRLRPVRRGVLAFARFALRRTREDA